MTEINSVVILEEKKIKLKDFVKACEDCGKISDGTGIFCRDCGGHLKLITDKPVLIKKKPVNVDELVKDNLYSALLIFFSILIGFFISIIYELLFYSSVDISNNTGNGFLKAGILGIMIGLAFSSLFIFYCQPKVEKILGKEILRLDIAYYSISTSVLGILLFY